MSAPPPAGATDPTPGPADLQAYVEAHMADLGHVTWHCSDEDSGPDVGLTVGLGDGRHLWAGEITKERHESEDCAHLGSDGGWWLILYGPKSSDTRVVGKCLDGEAARHLIDVLEVALSATRPIPTDRDRA